MADQLGKLANHLYLTMIGDFLPLVGGSKNTEYILDILEKLCTMQEVSVREAVPFFSQLFTLGNESHPQDLRVAESRRNQRIHPSHRDPHVQQRMVHIEVVFGFSFQ